MYRGIIHFHSTYSYDSLVSIEYIVNFAKRNKLNFLILTDHETIKGSVELKKYIEINNLDIEVVIAAEYNTEYGDLIAIDIQNEIINMNFFSFVEEVKKQSGIILLPHPYKGHRNINILAEYSDMIEVFNSRVDDENNKKALDLSIKYNKPIYYSADSHTKTSLGNSILEFPKNGSFINSLINSEIKQVSCKKTYIWEVLYSQYIKSIKSKNYLLFYELTKSLIKLLITFKIYKKIK